MFCKINNLYDEIIYINDITSLGQATPFYNIDCGDINCENFDVITVNNYFNKTKLSHLVYSDFGKSIYVN